MFECGKIGVQRMCFMQWGSPYNTICRRCMYFSKVLGFIYMFNCLLSIAAHDNKGVGDRKYDYCIKMLFIHAMYIEFVMYCLWVWIIWGQFLLISLSDLIQYNATTTANILSFSTFTAQDNLSKESNQTL